MARRRPRQRNKSFIRIIDWFNAQKNQVDNRDSSSKPKECYELRPIKYPVQVKRRNQSENSQRNIGNLY
jgi:hypothetical protein